MLLFLHWDKQYLPGLLFCILQVKLCSLEGNLCSFLQNSVYCFDARIDCRDLMTFLFYPAYFCNTESTNYA